MSPPRVKTSARLATKKRQQHTSHINSIHCVDDLSDCQDSDPSCSGRTHAEDVLGSNNDEHACPSGELNPRCPLQPSLSMTESVSERAEAWARMV